jgi:hypothetical protein
LKGHLRWNSWDSMGNRASETHRVKELNSPKVFTKISTQMNTCISTCSLLTPAAFLWIPDPQEIWVKNFWCFC